MTGATVLGWSMFYPVSISSLKQGCPLPLISVAKEESLNGRYVRRRCLCTAYAPREAQVSNTGQLFRALSPTCSPEVVNNCITRSLSFSHCPITFMWETRVLTALLDFISKALMQPWVMQSAECIDMKQCEYYPILRSCTLALTLLDNYRKFAINSCLLTRRVTSCDCVLVSCKATRWREVLCFPKHKNVAMKSQPEALRSMWSYTQVFSHLWVTYSWSGRSVVSL